MLLGVRLTRSFSKSCRKKDNSIASDQIFEKPEYLKKKWELCYSINWPSNLVNNTSGKCSII